MQLAYAYICTVCQDLIHSCLVESSTPLFGSLNNSLVLFIIALNRYFFFFFFFFFFLQTVLTMTLVLLYLSMFFLLDAWHEWVKQ